MAPPRLEVVTQGLIDAGHIPMVTHPERLTWIEDHYETMMRLVHAGALMQIPAPGEANVSALHIRFDGYFVPDLAAQLLALAPGTYRLSGLVRSAGDGSEAFAWTVTCADSPASVLG